MLLWLIIAIAILFVSLVIAYLSMRQTQARDHDLFASSLPPQPSGGVIDAEPPEPIAEPVSQPQPIFSGTPEPVTPGKAGPQSIEEARAMLEQAIAKTKESTLQPVQPEADREPPKPAPATPQPTVQEGPATPLGTFIGSVEVKRN